MRGRHLLIVVAGITALSGCARWQPDTGARPSFAHACPLTRAPEVTDFGPAGLRAIYHFVTQDASDDELGALIRGTSAAGFELMFMTVNLNGRDTVFANGAGVLHSQREVDTEFAVACRIGMGRVYLTHVRYNPAGEPGPVRAR